MFNHKVKEQRINNNETIIADAITALNQLTKAYQDISDHITIELGLPWVKHEHDTYGEHNNEGIIGVIDFKSSSGTDDLHIHPFVEAMKTIGLKMFSQSWPPYVEKYRCCFMSHDLTLLKQLPEKCQECIEENLNQRQGLGLS